MAELSNVDELVAQYYGEILPQNNLSCLIIGTYAQVFEHTWLADDQRLQGAQLLDFIRGKHPPD